MMRLKSILTISAILSLVIPMTGLTAFADHVTDFGTASNWSITATGNVKTSTGPTGTIRAEFSSDQSHAKSVTIKLNKPVIISENALRVGLWLYAARPIAYTGEWALLEDADGRSYEYTLQPLATKQKGWQYIDTFPFNANELGRLHPQVGKLIGGGTGLPKPPLKFKGIRFEADAASQGEILFHSVESDQYTLGSHQWHWALTIPGSYFRLDTCMIRSDEPPHILAGQLLPDGGDANISWQIQSGYQGEVIRSGSQRLTFAEDDIAAKRAKIELGELPAGQYNVVVSRRLWDPQRGTPTAWKRLVWQATGDAAWRDTSAADGSRFVAGEKTDDGNGYAGWRQTVKIGASGACVLKASGRGNGHPEVRVTPLDRERKSIGRTFDLKFGKSENWSVRELNIDLPAGTEYAYIDLVATRKGDAAFDAMSLRLGDRELIDNGSFEQGEIFQQLVYPLSVISSTSKSAYRDPPVWSVHKGEALSIPAPVWHNEAGEKLWSITDKNGKIVASGTVSGSPVVWKPLEAGVYQYAATRRVSNLEMDRQTLQLGCRTPAESLGEEKYVAREKVQTEKEIFDSGKNYFTWSMYEYHPEEPNFYKETQQWIKDGRAAGFSLFRLRVDWSKAEPMPGVYDFDMTDRLVADIIREGGQVILEPILSPPIWLRTDPQLNNFGRGDVWKRGYVERLASVWSPGMLDAIRRFNEALVIRYRNNISVAGYHLWGLPGSVDWTSVDQPWLGQRMDYSPASLSAFYQWSKGKYSSPPMASEDWNNPDLSDAWRDWVAFRAYGLEHFFIDSVLTPIRKLDDRRPIVGYFGLDYASPKLAESSRTMQWRRHTGGCELYYQIPLQAMRAVFETGRSWPQEVHYLTPLAPALEQATYQIGATGGDGYNWNYYWRNNYAVGTWTTDRENGLVEWKKFWRDLWKELYTARLARQPDVAGVSTWSTMHYGVRSYFPLRLGDYATRTAAAMYRDQLWPTWFSENASFENLKSLKLIVVPHGAAQVMPARMADALADYVRQGGSLVMFPDSGKWVIEDGQQTGALLKRVGWKQQLHGKNSSLQSVDLGNSGLPPLADHDRMMKVKFDETSKVFSTDQNLTLTQTIAVPAGNYQVVARFEDNRQPAMITWSFGKGRVMLIAGHPDWVSAQGLMSSLYHWAGGAREVGTSAPFVQVNHLVKDDIHYVVMHRMPDSLSPRFPMPYADLDRQKLHEMAPEISIKWYLNGLAKGQWRVEDLTAQIVPMTEQTSAVYSSDELGRGISAKIFLAQTRVFRITPATGK